MVIKYPIIGLLIDGSYLLHRSLKQPIAEKMINSKGNVTGGIVLFLQSLIKEHNQLSLSLGKIYPIILWDKGLSDRRKQIFPEYKANRGLAADCTQSELDASNKYMDAFRWSRTQIHQLTSTLGIANVRIAGYEGDDLLAYSARYFTRSVILSDDKDFIQLVSADTVVRRPIADQFINENTLKKEFPYGQNHYLTYKSILGDPSDNIGGIPKIGKVHAKRISDIIMENPETYKDIIGKSKKVVDKSFIDNHHIYMRNLSLIDLIHIDFAEHDSYIYDTIKAEINIAIDQANLLRASKMLGLLEIQKIDLFQYNNKLQNSIQIMQSYLKN